MAPTEPFLITPRIHRNDRERFLETFRASDVHSMGVDHPFAQSNLSRSRRDVARGLIVQIGRGLAKLVRCVRGSVWDVVVDTRPESPRFGEHQVFVLNDDRHHAPYVPIGFAHSFAVLSSEADGAYDCSSYYDPGAELTIAHDDPDLAVAWPLPKCTLSPRDAAAPRLAEVRTALVVDHPLMS